MANTIVLQVDAETGRAEADAKNLGGALTKALRDGEREAGELGDALSGAGRDADKLGDEARQAGRDAGKALGDAEREAEDLGDALTGAGRDADQLGDKFGGLGEGITSNLGGIVAGIGLLGAVTAIVDKTGELQRLSTLSQVSVEDFQVLAYQVRATGGDTDDLADSLREMQLRLAEASALGSGPAVDALALIGLGLDDIKRLDAPAQFALIRDRIREVEDPARRLFLADELLGGSAERLAGFLGLTVDEYADLVVESENARFATEDNVVAIKSATRELKEGYNVALVEGINLLGGIIEVTKEFTDVLANHKDSTDDQREAEEKRIPVLANLQDLTVWFFTTGPLADAVRGDNRESTLELAGAVESLRLGLDDEGIARQELQAEIEANTLATDTAKSSSDDYLLSLQAQREELGLITIQAGLTVTALLGVATTSAAQPDVSGWTRVATELGLGSDSALRFSASNLAAAATLDAVAAVAAGSQFEDIEIFATARNSALRRWSPSRAVSRAASTRGWSATSTRTASGRVSPSRRSPRPRPSRGEPAGPTARVPAPRRSLTLLHRSKTPIGLASKACTAPMYDGRQRRFENQCTANGGRWVPGREPNFNSPLDVILSERFDGECRGTSSVVEDSGIWREPDAGPSGTVDSGSWSGNARPRTGSGTPTASRTSTSRPSS